MRDERERGRGGSARLRAGDGLLSHKRHKRHARLHWPGWRRRWRPWSPPRPRREFCRDGGVGRPGEGAPAREKSRQSDRREDHPKKYARPLLFFHISVTKMGDAGHEPPRPPAPSSRASSLLGGSGGGGTTAADDRGGGGPGQSATDAIVATRSGDVLMKHTLLKSDHFPGVCGAGARARGRGGGGCVVRACRPGEAGAPGRTRGE